MPYCPKCNAKYEPGSDHCPVCGGRLEDAPQGRKRKGSSDDVDSVLLLKTVDYLKAHLLAGALENAGIGFWAKRLGMGGRLGSSGTASIDHVVYDGPKPAEIYVLPHDLDKARDILAALEEDADDDQ
jgi:hypothetical protein